MTYSCKLGPHKFGLLAYADDLVCLSPTKTGLQKMVSDITNELDILCLNMNALKSKCMVFEKCRRCTPLRLFIKNSLVENVKNFTYLGIIIKHDLVNDLDIARCNRSYLKQFNSMFRRFHYIDIEGKLFLYKTYCTSFYGCEMWHNLKGCSASFNELRMSYHKSLKKLHGIPYRTSNHDVCDASGLFTFDHYLSQRLLSFIFRIEGMKNWFLGHMKSFLIKRSDLMQGVSNRFQNMYSIDNIFDNDYEALKSRIKFVSDREPRFVRPDIIVL